MKKQFTPRNFSRRNFLKLAGQGALLGALASAVPALAKTGGSHGPHQLSRLARKPLASHSPAKYLRLVATDNMDDVMLPGRTDPLYIFGFREVTAADLAIAPAAGSLPITAPIDDLDVLKGRVQMPSPIIGVEEGQELYLTLTNIGFVGRPDLDDSHTIHWHGFRNPVALFDGVPEVSISVPPARNFPYYYRPTDPGTYMYHCHFEDSEHVQMGMDGIVYVNPHQNFGPAIGGFTQFAYNDGDGSTGYHRHWTLLLNEIDTRPHDGLLAVQEFVWSDYKPTYWVMNGRSYPDTILPGSAMPSQTISSLIKIEEGERGLLRLVNLGYEQHAMQMTGIRMTVVGEDATLLRGPGPGFANLYYDTNTVYIGPGEARDVLFTAPPHSTGTPGDPPDVYLFKNRSYEKLVNPGASGLGGMATEVHVYPDGDLPAQTGPNT